MRVKREPPHRTDAARTIETVLQALIHLQHKTRPRMRFARPEPGAFSLFTPHFSLFTIHSSLLLYFPHPGFLF